MPFGLGQGLRRLKSIALIALAHLIVEGCFVIQERVSELVDVFDQTVCFCGMSEGVMLLSLEGHAVAGFRSLSGVK